jgi:hypothetical protein
VGSDALNDELDLLTWRAHEINAFCGAWIQTWLVMEASAQTPAQRDICRREIENWTKVRSRAVQATYADINELLRRHR